MMFMVEVKLFLGPPTSTSKNRILEEIGIMGGFRHLILSAQRLIWRYLGVGIIQLVILMVICLVLLLETVNVVWVLGQPNLPPQKLIAVLMVAILFCQGVGNINPRVIHNNIVTIINQLLVGSIIIVLMEMVEVVLVLGKPNSTPQKRILSDTGIMGDIRNLSVSAQNLLWNYLGVGIIQLVLLMVIYLVLLLETIKVVWVLGPHTLPPKFFLCINGGNFFVKE